MRRWLAGRLWWRSTASRWTALRCSPTAGGCGTRRPADGSNSPRRPLACGEGQPAMACAPRRHRRRPASHRLIPFVVGRVNKGSGLSGSPAGRLVGAEKHSDEVGTRSVLRRLTCRSCLSAAAFGPRSEFSGTTSARASQGSSAVSGTTHMKPCRRPAQPARHTTSVRANPMHAAP